MYVAIIQIVHGEKLSWLQVPWENLCNYMAMEFVQKIVLHPHMLANKLTVLMSTLYYNSLHVLAITLVIAFHV